VGSFLKKLKTEVLGCVKKEMKKKKKKKKKTIE
jgi:hypothetical protein